MTMHPQVALLLTLILLLAAGDGSLAETVVTKTCGAIDRATGGTRDYQYCVDALSADRAAASAKDARELAVAATSLAAANITSTVLVLEDLVNNLGQCLQIYREMTGPLKGALGDLRAGHVDAGHKKLKHVSGQPELCSMLLLAGSAQRSPIEEENRDGEMLCGLSEDITGLILGYLH